MSGCTRGEHRGGGHWWSDRTFYVFRRAERGWELAGARTLSNADGGCALTDEDKEP